MGPESFEMIYKNIAYDREQQARAAAMANPTSPRGAAGGSQGVEVSSLSATDRPPTVRGVRSRGLPMDIMSIREAYEAALREHGVG